MTLGYGSHFLSGHLSHNNVIERIEREGRCLSCLVLLKKMQVANLINKQQKQKMLIPGLKQWLVLRKQSSPKAKSESTTCPSLSGDEVTFGT